MLIYFCKKECESKYQLTATNRIRYFLKGKQVNKNQAYPITSERINISRKTNDECNTPVEKSIFFPLLPPPTQKDIQKKEKREI